MPKKPKVNSEEWQLVLGLVVKLDRDWLQAPKFAMCPRARSVLYVCWTRSTSGTRTVSVSAIVQVTWRFKQHSAIICFVPYFTKCELRLTSALAALSLISIPCAAAGKQVGADTVYGRICSRHRPHDCWHIWHELAVNSGGERHWGTTGAIVLGCFWIFIALYRYTCRRRILWHKKDVWEACVHCLGCWCLPDCYTLGNSYLMKCADPTRILRCIQSTTLTMLCDHSFLPWRDCNYCWSHAVQMHMHAL